ncbi:hypothetical protein, partial [Shinella sp.]|uniref:hypothetical protein n=1 Tax=Shinella sp. TaxID=1870904 RepID=UPI002636977A
TSTDIFKKTSKMCKVLLLLVFIGLFAIVARRSIRKAAKNLVQVVKFFSETVLRVPLRPHPFPALLSDAAPGYSDGETKPEKTMSFARDGASFTGGAH